MQNAQAQPSGVSVTADASAVVIKTAKAEFRVLPSGYIQSFLVQDGQRKTLDRPADQSSDYAVVEGKPVTDIKWDLSTSKTTDTKGKLGAKGKRVEITGFSPSTGLEQTISFEVYDDFPQIVIASAAFKNSGNTDLKLDKVIAAHHAFDASLGDASAKPNQLWAFQGSSLDWGKDEIFPVPASYSEQNPMGKPGKTGNYGGGLPVNAFWTRDVGIAIGHLETLPLVLDMPIHVAANKPIEASIELNDPGVLKPGETFSTPRTFVAVYSGDFYEPLRM
jgi:alpha-galactosidase